jgi:hypothetical protein
VIPATLHRGGRLAVVTAVAGTVLIAAGAFWLSFTALADLARRSGVDAAQAWAWPVIVDGLIVVSTVAVVALAGQRAAWYPWVLLGGGAVISVTANALHAIVAADADVPGVLAASVAAVPPLVLLASTHLTVVLVRSGTTEPAEGAEEKARAVAEDLASEDSSVSTDAVPSTPARSDRRVIAAGLREAGWSNKAIARHFHVAPSTVGRWFAARGDAPDEQPTPKELSA